MTGVGRARATEDGDRRCLLDESRRRRCRARLGNDPMKTAALSWLPVPGGAIDDMDPRLKGLTTGTVLAFRPETPCLSH